MILDANARNRYDAAKAIEWQLQRDFGYSLEMKASGPDPLADFLFNIKAGHCEYFATAMACCCAHTESLLALSMAFCRVNTTKRRELTRCGRAMRIRGLRFIFPRPVRG